MKIDYQFINFIRYAAILIVGFISGFRTALFIVKVLREKNKTL